MTPDQPGSEVEGMILPDRCTGHLSKYRGYDVIEHHAHCTVHDLYGFGADAQYRAIDRDLALTTPDQPGSEGEG